MKIRRIKVFFLLVPVLIGSLFAPMGTVFAYSISSNKMNFRGPDTTPLVIENELFRTEVSSDGNTQLRIHDITFSTSISPRIGFITTEASLTNPLYVKGWAKFTLNCVFPSTSNMTNTSLFSIDVSYCSLPDGISCTVYQPESYGPIFFYFYFDNFCLTSSDYFIDCPTVTVRDTVSVYESTSFDTGVLPDVSQLNMEWYFANYTTNQFTFLTAPDVSSGMASIIRDSVVNAINSSSVSDVAIFLNSIYQQDITAYGQILNYLADLSSDSENIKLYLMANLPDILTKVQSISSEQLRFNSAMYDLIYNYIYSTPSDTAAQSVMANESAAMASAANALEVSKPNIQALVQAPDSLINNDVKNSQISIFAWVNHFRILPILLIVFTLAILSFVLYGKSG